MFIEILLAIIIGCVLGTITGLIPGLHINLVAAIIFGIVPALSAFLRLEPLAVIIVSMSITHTFVDFIPAIFLGAASEGTAFSSMPGNEFLLDGFGMDAVRLVVIGCFFGLISIALLFPLLLLVVPAVYSAAKEFTAFVLIAASIFLVLWKESLNTAFWNLFIFVLSGVLGVLVLSSNVSEPLLPMLSGLFGISLLLVNLKREVVVPLQHTVELISIKACEVFRSITLGVFSGSIISIFPALGPAHSAAIATRAFGKSNSSVYLMLLGCISSVSMLMSLITLYSFGKARNGSIAIMGDFSGDLGFGLFLLLLTSAIVAACIAVFITIILGRVLARKIGEVDYRLVSLVVILIVCSLVLLFSGLLGALILIASASIGIIPIIKNVNRSSAMGCLIIPVILYFLA